MTPLAAEPPPLAGVPSCGRCVDCTDAPIDARVVRMTFYNQSRLRSADTVEILKLANRIWRPYGVTLQNETGPDALVVVLSGGVLSGSDRWGSAVLGTTLFTASHATPYIRLSLGAAERIAGESADGGPAFSSFPRQRRDGILVQMLGVALAHELGHYLLDTREHSQTGLLQARLAVRDMEHPDMDRLVLTPEQQQTACRVAGR